MLMCTTVDGTSMAVICCKMSELKPAIPRESRALEPTTFFAWCEVNYKKSANTRL